MISILFLLVLGGFVAFAIAYHMTKQHQGLEDPYPYSDTPKNYLAFLNNVETVLKADLSEDKLNMFLGGIQHNVEHYSKDPRFLIDFYDLLDKYDIDWEY